MHLLTYVALLGLSMLNYPVLAYIGRIACAGELNALL